MKARVKRRPKSGEKRPNPREVVARILVQWEECSPVSRPPLSQISSDVIDQAGQWDPRDKALAWELVFGVVRHLLFLDHRIREFLHSRKALHPLVQAHLRIGAYQIFFLDRVPPSAAVNEAVKAVRSAGQGWASGLVNAVLRKLSAFERDLGRDRARKVDVEGWGEDKLLSVETSHPLWMVKRWIRRYGISRTRKLCEANNFPAPITLRINTLKITVDEALELLTQSGIDAIPGAYSPVALRLPHFRGDPSMIPGLSQGLFQVQDEASQLVSMLVAPGSGQNVLDACAGLGGKTTHLAELSRDMGSIDATDPNTQRLSMLEDNARRLGLKSINIIPYAHFDKGAESHRKKYHKVLIDAPCSGLGVIRRHPDIKWNRSPQDVGELSKVQAELLRRFSRLVPCHGELIYSVCTMEPEETVEQVQAFLEQNTGWELVSAEERLPVTARGLMDREGFLQILPTPDGPDGFFAAVLRHSMSA